MSKYKVGDKFIVEIEEVRENKAPFDNTYIVKGGFGFVEMIFDRMQKIDSNMKIEDITDMIAEYDTEKKGYNKGLQDAWELLKKIVFPVGEGGINSKDLMDMFGVPSTYRASYWALRNFTPKEVLAKLQAYEKEREEIKVGDVVRFKKHPSCEVLITAVSRGLNGVHLHTGEFGRKGEVHSDICKDYIEKTGKHIDIESLLGQIAE